MQERGENWRNERLNGESFSFPRAEAWDVPEIGILEFDFVHLDEVQDEDDCLYEEDYVALQSQMARIMSSSGKIELLKQVLDCASP